MVPCVTDDEAGPFGVAVGEGPDGEARLCVAEYPWLVELLSMLERLSLE